MSKPLDRITLLSTFVRIADAGSISAAARDIGLSQPSVSRQLAELETRLKVQLMRRTTHSLALTDAGADLLADARLILDSWEALEEKYLAGETHIQGKLKVVAPVALGQMHLARIASQFQRNYPGVTFNWILEDKPIRFAEIGCDCWVKIGQVLDETLIVRKVGTVERILAASKDFIAEYGMPTTPKQVGELPLIALEPFEGGHIPLHQDKRSLTIKPDVKMQTNNIFALKQAVDMGVGMAVMPKWFIANELASGELVDLLPKWRAQSLDIHICYLPGRHQSKRLKTFIKVIGKEIPEIEGIEPVTEIAIEGN
ncbi:MAG: LysR family transcriptional regulator [Pseudomonadota bacterium]